MGCVSQLVYNSLLSNQVSNVLMTVTVCERLVSLLSEYPQAVSTPPPRGSPQLANQQAPHVDSETLACHWVQAYYEYGGSPENATSPPVVAKSHLYLEYLSTCKRTGVHYVVNDKTFAGCVRYCNYSEGTTISLSGIHCVARLCNT